MKNSLLWLLAALLALLLFGGNSYYQKNCNCGGASTPSVSTLLETSAAGATAISIADGAAFKGGTDDNLRFGRNSYEHALPISDKLNTVFNSTAAYLKEHPDRSMKITGFYNKMEKNTSIYPNLGLARANHIKAMLTGLGAPASQILTDAVIQLDDTFVKDSLTGGATYSFSDFVKDDSRLADIEKHLRANPIILYFGTNQNDLTLSDAQRKDFADLLYYLDNKKGAKATSTGHTDNKGSAEKNTALSAQRAEFVRNYLSKNGVNAAQMSTSGKGPTQPTVSNDTEEGRAKNRRVEVGIE
jgi:OmpA-OmpF porin, OOP family